MLNSDCPSSAECCSCSPRVLLVQLQLQVLVGKTLEQSMMEVLEEEELASLQRRSPLQTERKKHQHILPTHFITTIPWLRLWFYSILDEHELHSNKAVLASNITNHMMKNWLRPCSISMHFLAKLCIAVVLVIFLCDRSCCLVTFLLAFEAPGGLREASQCGAVGGSGTASITWCDKTIQDVWHWLQHELLELWDSCTMLTFRIGWQCEWS